MKDQQIHLTQQAFRSLLDCMAKPGKIVTLASREAFWTEETGCYPATLLLMQVLLDSEVSFHLVSERRAQITGLVRSLTHAREAELEKADYVFLFQDARAEERETALRFAKKGTLTDPDQSATMIFEAAVIEPEAEISLKGPGIKGQRKIKIELAGNWILERERANQEYPLGVDCIFVDAQSRLACLPRTTEIVKEQKG